MIILVNSKITCSSIQSSLGKSEYSYYFLLKQFMPALEHIARVIQVDSSDEVDSHYHELTASGEQVVFISVSPPQQTPTDLKCPTVCLFAWEFHDAPDQAWDDNPHNDWRYPLSRVAGAIACSRESAQAVRNLMGENYPVTAIPAPVWAHFGDLMPAGGWRPGSESRSLAFSGHAIDSPTLGLSANGLVQHLPRPARHSQSRKVQPNKTSAGALRITGKLLMSWLLDLGRSRIRMTTQWRKGKQPPPSPAGTQAVNDCQFDLSGVVFTSVLSPSDGRKNWTDIVTAFCWAFRDNADATLILKMTHHDLEFYRIPLLTLLSRLAPFQCRVLTLHGFLSDEQFRELIKVTDFYVNASSGEGLCLPLMEFLSSGKPVLAPCHTAMRDYLDDQVAHLVDSSEELACWSHDPTGTQRSRRHRLNWESLMQGYRTCYQQTRKDPDSYQRMSLSAWQRMRDFSDTPVIAKQLESCLTPMLAGQPAGAL